MQTFGSHLHVLCVQAVHAEMEEALHEKDELKMRVHSYISEVARIENIMLAKVSSNTLHSSSIVTLGVSLKGIVF